jgi:hypothetical protein
MFVSDGSAEIVEPKGTAKLIHPKLGVDRMGMTILNKMNGLADPAKVT